jgi:predicted ATP-dependent endonuclease of OLD family
MRTARVRLVKFRILAYRSCKHTQLNPLNEVTALIGPNGSGKTNLLQGMVLLGTSSIRRRRYTEDDELYTSRCRIEASFLFKRKIIRYRAVITYRPTETARDEVAASDERWNFKDLDGNPKWIRGEDIELIMRRVQRGLYVVQAADGLFRTISTHRSLGHDRKVALSREATLAFEAIRRFRSAITYYSASQFTNPALSPTSFDIDEDGDLRNDPVAIRRPTHTRFIYDLYHLSTTNPRAYDAFLSLVDKRGVRLIDKIKWRDVKFSSPAYEVRSGGKVITQRRKRIMIIPTVHVGTSQLSFNQLSEGSLRTLAMLFYITTDKSELLLIEEPEVCVHHGLLKSVIEVIKEFGRSKQIIFSTHSEAVIDSLRPEQVLLVQRRETSGTIVTPISKAMSRAGYDALKNYLQTTGSLGEFWRHSGFTK